MEIGAVTYVVEVDDYVKFKFDGAYDAVEFATTSLVHGRDGVRVNIELVWNKKEKEMEEK